MSQYKQVKLYPNQSNFSANQKVVDFHIDSGVYDLSQSDIIINIDVNHTDGAAVVNSASGDSSGVYDNGLLFYQTSSSVSYQWLVNNDLSKLVKNCQISSDKFGVIESIPHNSEYRTNLAAYTMDDDQQIIESHNNNMLNSIQYGMGGPQALNVLNCVSDKLSEKRSVDLKIPLHSLFGIARGQNNVYDCNQNGALTIHSELLLDKIAASAFSDSTHLQSQYNNGDDASNNEQYDAMEDVPVNSGATDVEQTFLITKIKYKSMEDLPYWVGQRINITFTETGAAAVTVIQKILSIEQINVPDQPAAGDTNQQKVKINLDGYYHAFAQTKGATDVTISHLGPTSSSIQINNVNLKMMEVQGVQSPKSYIIDCITTHKDTFPAVEYMNQIYTIPPNTKSCWVVFPEPGYIWSKDEIESYRIIIDNEALTDREIIYNSPEHKDLQIKTFLNSGNSRLMNLGGNLKNWNFPNDNTYDSLRDVTMICFPVQFLPRTQILQLEIEGVSTLSGQIQLNFERVKQVQ